MRRGFWCSLLLATAVGCSRGDVRPARVETVTITAENELHTFDVGPLFLDSRLGGLQTATHEFQIANPSSTDPMTLRVESKPCGCTRLVLPDEPTPPGKNAVVQMEVNAPGQEMARAERVVLHSNLPEAKPIHLVLQFHSMPRLEGTLAPGSEPRRLVIEPGEVAKLHFAAITRQPSDEAPTTVQVEVAGERAALSGPLGLVRKTIDGARQTESQFDLQIDLQHADVNDPELWREHEGEVRLRQEAREVVQKFVWRLRSEIEASPRAVFLHPDASGHAERQITLAALEPFAVLESPGAPDGLTVAAASSSPGRVQQVRVRLDATQASGARPGETTLKLATSHPRQRAVYLPAYVLWNDDPRQATMSKAP